MVLTESCVYACGYVASYLPRANGFQSINRRPAAFNTKSMDECELGGTTICCIGRIFSWFRDSVSLQNSSVTIAFVDCSLSRYIALMPIGLNFRSVMFCMGRKTQCTYRAMTKLSTSVLTTSSLTTPNDTDTFRSLARTCSRINSSCSNGLQFAVCKRGTLRL